MIKISHMASYPDEKTVKAVQNFEDGLLRNAWMKASDTLREAGNLNPKVSEDTALRLIRNRLDTLQTTQTLFSDLLEHSPHTEDPLADGLSVWHGENPFFLDMVDVLAAKNIPNRAA